MQMDPVSLDVTLPERISNTLDTIRAELLKSKIPVAYAEFEYEDLYSLAGITPTPSERV